jgi:hypothetical protein
MAAAPGRRRQLPHRTRRRASAAAAPPIRRWCAMTAGGCTGAASPAACRWRRGGVRGAAQGSRRDSAARATTAQRAGRLIGSGGRSYSSGGAQAEWRWARFTPPTTVLIVTFKCSVWRWRSRRLPLPQQPRDPRGPPPPPPPPPPAATTAQRQSDPHDGLLRFDVLLQPSAAASPCTCHLSALIRHQGSCAAVARQRKRTGTS